MIRTGMDAQVILKFFHDHWLELLGLCTLGLSLWIAFGLLRHRLPKVITRFGKYSAALKLLGLSGVCWFGLYHALTDDEPSAAVNWLLGCLGLLLLVGALWVLTRPQTARHHGPHGRGPNGQTTPGKTASSKVGDGKNP